MEITAKSHMHSDNYLDQSSTAAQVEMYASRTYYDRETKIWCGADVPRVFHPDVSIGQVAMEMFSRAPDKIVQISDSTGIKITAKKMKELSIRAAQNMQGLGLEQEDVIGVVAANSTYLAPLMFGSFLCGFPISPLDPSFDKGEIKHMFSITKPKIVLCDFNVCTTVSEALKEINSTATIFTLKDKLKGFNFAEDLLKETGTEDLFVAPKLVKGGAQTAAIICSSGTTGLPKGVCATHEALLNRPESIIFTSDVLLCFSTMYWLSGMMILLLGTLSGATRLITDEPFTPELMLRLIEKYKVTILLTPPSQMAMALNSPDIKTRDLSTVRVYLCGGSAVPVVVAKAMHRYLPNGDVVIGYGMSELAGLCTIETPQLRREGSAGQVLTRSQIKIIDDNNQHLGIGEKGEIIIKAGYKGLGYYGNEEATRNVFDNDGWVHSGDIGYFDKDGFIFIVDRKKEILKYKNFHFYPTEIESVLLQIPDVIEVCVTGVADIVYTDLPAAAVCKKKDSPLTEDDVYQFVADRMAHFKHLRGGVLFVEQLPKTASGKTKRQQVRDLLESAYKSNKVKQG